MKYSIIGGIIAAFFMVSSAFAADVDGEWTVSMSAAEGGTMVSMSINVDGEKATALIGGDEFTGTYINGELKLAGQFYVPDAGMSAELDLTARLEDDELKGTANWDMYVAEVHGTRKE